MQQKLISSTLLIYLLSCSGNNLSAIIDLDGWKSENAACNGTRVSIVENILDHKSLFRGLQQEEIVNLLGVPDRHQLYNRNQKFFIYYLNLIDCNKDGLGNEFAHLSIRFNSLGKLSEMVVVN